MTPKEDVSIEMREVYGGEGEGREAADVVDVHGPAITDVGGEVVVSFESRV